MACCCFERFCSALVKGIVVMRRREWAVFGLDASQSLSYCISSPVEASGPLPGIENR